MNNKIIENTLNTYLGQKGYTILKKELTAEQQQKIRDELTIKPFIPNSPASNNAVTFPAYRESSNKLYIPHYYGIEHFGNPKQYKISEGDTINLIFKGALRDYQVPVVDKFLSHVKNDIYSSSKGGLLELFCAWGKTSASLYILSMLKKKTIVIVHKEFLMNQWIERIGQFLPEARVGKIQGQVIDIENKDIVLCMLQSLVLKEYPESIFSSFGFTIIDEVHHISSQTFSNALFKLVTKYMLGLSATMDRKDGTTKVFKMFLGEVVYKALKKEDTEVEVRTLFYKARDEEFNETIYDYRGNPQISSMISKLCSFNHRTEFIIKTLNDFIRIDNTDINSANQHKDAMDQLNPFCKICNKNNNYLIKNTCCNIVKYCLPCLNNIIEEAKTPQIKINKKTGVESEVKCRPKCPACSKVLSFEQNYIENPYIKPLKERHIIVMSHNLNILKYMYDKFICKNYASVGYYVGGMSELELKKAEKQQVIFSTYVMCSEGLDIPSLNTEFLITPKTDIIQIVGRILRAKQKNINPIIYDFVDSHDIFQRQWLKRKSYYKKQNYKIIKTTNETYNTATSKWVILYDPKKNGCSMKDNNSDSEDDQEERNVRDDKSDILKGKCLIPFLKKGKNVTVENSISI